MMDLDLTHKIKNLKTYILVFLTTFFWGFTYHLSKYTLQFIEPTQLALFRFIFGLLFLLIYLFIFYYNNLKSIIHLIQKSLDYKKYRFILSFIGILIFHSTFYKDIELCNPEPSTILFAFPPATTALFIRIWKKEAQSCLRIWKKEPQPFLRILGIIIAFTGVFLTTFDSFVDFKIQTLTQNDSILRLYIDFNFLYCVGNLWNCWL